MLELQCEQLCLNSNYLVSILNYLEVILISLLRI